MPRTIEIPDHPIASLVLRASGGDRAPEIGSPTPAPPVRVLRTLPSGASAGEHSRDAIDLAAARLREVEEQVGLALAPTRIRAFRDDVDLTHEVAALLDATALVIDGAAMQACFTLVDRHGDDHLLSFREWGHHVAAWANRTLPLEGARRAPTCSCDACRTTPPGGYTYLDFYDATYVEPIFPTHDVWLHAWRDVVRRKVELFGAPFE